MAESPDVAIRPVARTEIPGVLELWAAADAVPSVTDDAAGIDGLLDTDAGALLVAVVDERIVGSVVAAWDGWRGNMYRLAVAPELRRRGIARALVEAAEAHLRRRGARRVTALLVREHEHASGFWAATGYEHDRRIDRYVRTLGGGVAGQATRE